MTEDSSSPKGLRPQELEAVYAISRAVEQSVDVDSALDVIIKIARPVFIYDNIVLYLPKNEEVLEPAYARVIGRGRSAEADLAWGEAIASEVLNSKTTYIHEEKLDGWEKDRLCWREFLGLPLRTGEDLIGALVFGRFGGPPYKPDQIHLAEFIGAHIAQLLDHQQLVERIASLEAERRLQRLQADFIAMVSHELCTPLGFIKGYATTLLREDTTWDDETRREFLTIIDEETDRLRDLIDNLLDSSRLKAGTMRMQFQPVRLDRLLREAALRASARYDNVSIELDLNADLILRVDPVRIAQVLDNLLSNAFKYAPGSPVIINSDNLGEKIQISVKDNGPGIAPEHLDSIFEQFYRVPDDIAKAHGTGLGLFICREIIHAHEGEISVESELNKGTIFKIILPNTKAE
jgi:signal transduction histidine kinase